MIQKTKKCSQINGSTLMRSIPTYLVLAHLGLVALVLTVVHESGAGHVSSLCQVFISLGLSDLDLSTFTSATELISLEVASVLEVCSSVLWHESGSSVSIHCYVIL